MTYLSPASASLSFSSGGVPIPIHAEEYPFGPSNSTVSRAAILLLQGSGGHVEFWVSRLAPFLREAGIHLYAPQYLKRTGTVRADLATITDGKHVPQWLETADDALRFVATRPGVDADRILVAGVSLGAFLALALAARLSASTEPVARRRICAVLDISGGLVPPYDALVTPRFPPTLILHGEADQIVPVSFARDLDRKLTDLGVAHRTELLPGEGHWFGPAALPRMLLATSAFLEQHLQS